MAIIKQSKNNLVGIQCLAFLIMLFSCIEAQTCGANCWKCDSPDLCTNCKTGFYLTNQYRCQSCPLGCIQCYRYDFCVTCSQGYTLSTQSQECLPCPQNCVSCSINMNSIRCSNCGTGSYLSNLNTQCEPCLEFCLECQNGNSCSVCALGFGYDPSDQRCQPCGANCLICEESGNSTMQCQTCEKGAYIDPSNPDNCVKCMSDCLACSNQTFCSSCIDYYYPLATNDSGILSSYCQKCPDQNCITCSPTNPLQCSSCSVGYFYNETTKNCVYCADNCVKCVSQDVCGTCLDGYYRTNDSKCDICGTACDQCSGPQNCTKCNGSYFLRDGACETCHYGCAKCSANGQCQTCISYQFALYENQCQYCYEFMWKCLSCINSTFCIQCDDNTYLYNGECITNNGGLSAWGIVLIILSIAIVLGALIFAIIKKKQSNNAAQQRAAGPYIEIP